MKGSYIILLFFVPFLFVVAINCQKSGSKPEEGWKLSPDNKYENPLGSIKESDKAQTTADTTKSNLRTTATSDYGCGAYITGNYYGVGYYAYPDCPLNLSGTPQGSTISVLVHSYDIPNRFTIKDANGTVYASTSWMGYVTYSGPWGMSLNTPETQTLTFALGTTTALILKVETSTTTYSDAWDASIGCTPPPTATYAGVTITFEPLNNILRFNSASDVNTVLDQLDADYDTYNDNYDAQYPNYTVDQLDYVDSINHFDELKTYIDFENLFTGYSSMRKQIENTEITWLANSMTGIDPDSIDYSFDDAQNTIFNTSYSFKIGSDVYQLRSDGIYINGVNQDQNARTTAASALCFSRRRHTFDYPPGTNRRYKVKVAVHSIVIRGEAKGKVVSFKPKGSGWKRCRSEMAINVGGNIYTPSCAFNFAFARRKPDAGYKKERQLKYKYRQYGAGGQIIYKTKTNEMSAIYELSSGYSFGLYL